MLELALLTPVLLSVSLGTFELARVQNIQQRMSFICSEAARTVFQVCNAPGAAASTVQCLQDAEAIVNANAQMSLPGVEVILSVYKYNVPNPLPSNEDYIQLQHITGVELSNLDPNTAGKTTSGHISKYTAPLDPLHTGNPDPMNDLFVHIPPLGNTIFPPQDPPVPNFPIGSIHPKNREIRIAEVYFNYTPSAIAQLLYFTPFAKILYEHTIL